MSDQSRTVEAVEAYLKSKIEWDGSPLSAGVGADISFNLAARIIQGIGAPLESLRDPVTFTVDIGLTSFYIPFTVPANKTRLSSHGPGEVRLTVELVGRGMRKKTCLLIEMIPRGTQVSTYVTQVDAIGFDEIATHDRHMIIVYPALNDLVRVFQVEMSWEVARCHQEAGNYLINFVRNNYL